MTRLARIYGALGRSLVVELVEADQLEAPRCFEWSTAQFGTGQRERA